MELFRKCHAFSGLTETKNQFCKDIFLVYFKTGVTNCGSNIFGNYHHRNIPLRFLTSPKNLDELIITFLPYTLSTRKLYFYQNIELFNSIKTGGLVECCVFIIQPVYQKKEKVFICFVSQIIQYK